MIEPKSEKFTSQTYSAFWKEGHATITVNSSEGYFSCLWSVSSGDESKNADCRKAKSLGHALKNIKCHLGFKPEFRLEPKDPIERMRRDIEEMFPDSALRTKMLEKLRKKAEASDQEYTWVAKWKRGRVEVSGSDRGGYLWDVFAGKDNDILDYGVAETKEEAFEKCSKATKQKLHFDIEESKW